MPSVGLCLPVLILRVVLSQMLTLMQTVLGFFRLLLVQTTRDMEIPARLRASKLNFKLT